MLTPLPEAQGRLRGTLFGHTVPALRRGRNLNGGRRRMKAKRLMGTVGVLLAIMIALTGCVKLNMSVKVNNEKSVDYEVVYAIQKSVLGDKSFDEFMESNGSGSQQMDVPEGATVVDYEDEKYKGKRITAANLDPAKLAESSSSENPFSLKKEGDFYVLSMGGVTGADSGDPQASSMAKSMFDEASVTFTFPGKVVEANGAKVDGNTATFDMLSIKETTVMAKAEANAGIPQWIIWALVALVVVAAALVLFLVLLRKKGAAPAVAGHGSLAPQGYGPDQAGYVPPAQQGYTPPAQQGFTPPAQPGGTQPGPKGDDGQDRSNPPVG